MSEPFVGDRPMAWPVRQHRVLAQGAISTFVEDEVVAPGTHEGLQRQYTLHPGAVGVVAVDADDRVVVVRQYRHPLGIESVELPAGLLDVPGEPAVLAAQRELAEEAQLQAEQWQVLIDSTPSPGASQESVRIFLATGLSPAERPEGFVLEGEEALMSREFVPLADLTAAVLAGSVQNGHLIAGILALQVARSTGTTLRPAQAPWPIREIHGRPDHARQG